MRLKISVIGKNINITGRTFALQVNFDDLSFLHIDHEQKALAQEMEFDLAKVEKCYPELKDKLRIALGTPEISGGLTVDRQEGDKIARLSNEHFKEIMIKATQLNFPEKHRKLLEELQNEGETPEISYPIYFHACGHQVDKDQNAEDLKDA